MQNAKAVAASADEIEDEERMSFRLPLVRISPENQKCYVQGANCSFDLVQAERAKRARLGYQK